MRKKPLYLIVCIFITTLFSGCFAEAVDRVLGSASENPVTPVSTETVPTQTTPAQTGASAQPTVQATVVPSPSSAQEIFVWEAARFGGLPKPDKLQLITPVAAEEGGVYQGFLATEEDYRAYAKAVEAAGFVSEEGVIAEAGGLLYAGMNAGGDGAVISFADGAGAIQYWPYAPVSPEWPSGEWPDLPVPDVAIAEAEATGGGSYIYQTEVWPSEDFIAYREWCKEAGYTLELVEGEDDGDLLFSAFNKAGDQIMIELSMTDPQHPTGIIVLTKAQGRAAARGRLP